MTEPAMRVLRCDRIERHSQGIEQRLTGAGGQPPQDGLELGERLLDGRQIGRVGGQEDELAATGLNDLPDGGRLVDAQRSRMTIWPDCRVGASTSRT